MKLFTLAAAALFAGTAYAQGISQCVLSCSQQAGIAASCTFSDPSCACTNAVFQNTAGACLLANCTASEQQQSRQLQAALCGNLSVTSGSVSATLPPATGSIALPSSNLFPTIITQSAGGGPASGVITSGSPTSSAAGGGGVAASSAPAAASSAPAAASSAPAAASSAPAAASSSRSAGERYEMGSWNGAVGVVVGLVGVVAGAVTVL